MWKGALKTTSNKVPVWRPHRQLINDGQHQIREKSRLSQLLSIVLISSIKNNRVLQQQHQTHGVLKTRSLGISYRLSPPEQYFW